MTAFLVMNSLGFGKMLPLTKAHVKTQKILVVLKGKIYVAGILCVLAKGFDHVNHRILLSHGLDGDGGKWFKSYVTNRSCDRVLCM
jgi:hypothetical protein